MSQDEDKTNDFFDRLAGKSPSNGSESSPGAEVLREALQAQVDTMRAAEQASADDLSAEEKAEMDVLKQQLLDRGLIGKPSTTTSPKTKERTNWLQRISEILLDTGWERPVALAASVAFAIAIGWQLALPPEIDSDIIVRGGATPEIATSEPAKFADTLAKELRGTGAKVLVVQINKNQWTVRIDVPSSANASAIQKVLTSKGIKLEGAPPYRLSVKKQE